jgi:hypothetical protein
MWHEQAAVLSQPSYNKLRRVVTAAAAAAAAAAAVSAITAASAAQGEAAGSSKSPCRGQGSE